MTDCTVGYTHINNQIASTEGLAIRPWAKFLNCWTAAHHYEELQQRSASAVPRHQNGRRSAAHLLPRRRCRSSTPRESPATPWPPERTLPKTTGRRARHVAGKLERIGCGRAVATGLASLGSNLQFSRAAPRILCWAVRLLVFFFGSEPGIPV